LQSSVVIKTKVFGRGLGSSALQLVATDPPFNS